MIDIFWWSKKKYENSDFENFGDYLVPFLLNKFTNQKFRRVEPNNNFKFLWFKRKHYFVIGSILRLATRHTIVWGAGIIQSNENVESAKFILVRGPLTRNRLLRLGYNVPEKYGDPALLLALLPQEKIIKKYKLGIIPHYVDFEDACHLYKNKIDVLVIDLCTNNPQFVINSILECEYILSSSLHGIIASHALNTPVLWVKISNRLYGDDVKFEDYYQSLELKNIKPLDFQFYTFFEIKILFSKLNSYAVPKKDKINKLILDLTDTFPFRRSPIFKYLIKKYFRNNE